MTGETLGDLVPLVLTAVLAFGIGGKGLRYVRAIYRALVEGM